MTLIQASAYRVATTLWLGLAMGCAMSHAGADEPSRGGHGPESVEGELIIKLTPSAGRTLEEPLRAGTPATATGLAWLDTLNARYGVTKIEPVFAHQPDAELMKRKYPQRTRRAPLDTEIPTLKYVYKLTLHPDANLRQAAADYGAQPDVEYAQPNYLATFQGGGSLP